MLEGNQGNNGLPRFRSATGKTRTAENILREAHHLYNMPQLSEEDLVNGLGPSGVPRTRGALLTNVTIHTHHRNQGACPHA